MLEVVPEVSPSDPPEFTSDPSGPAIVNTQWAYTFSGTDPDGDDAELVFEVLEAPTNWQRTGDTIQWTPQTGDEGSTFHFEIKLTDESGAWCIQSFDLPVVAAASTDVPEFTTVPYGPAIVNQTWTYDVQATDPDGDDDLLEYSLVTGEYPDGMYLEVIDDAVLGRYAHITWAPEQPSETGVPR